MEMYWTWKRFEEISGAEMHEMLSERQKVFIVDCQSWHLVGRDSEGMLAAYARINFPGARYKEPSFGRIFISQANRAIGLGHQIIQHCIEKCEIEYPDMTVRISAQTYLIGFYKEFCFEIAGQPYDDEGVEHIDMVLIPKLDV